MVWRAARRRSPLPPAVVALTYEITRDALTPDSPDPAILHMDEDDRHDLFDLVHHDPAAALPRLQAWVQRYPDSRTLRNWLAMAYSGVDDNVSAEQETRELYQRHPDYLFAKVAMAQFALHRGELDQVEAIFDQQFDLKLLYPHRDVFHLTEFLAFARVMVEYFLRKRNHHTARLYYDMMNKLAPDHPLTCQARQVMSGSTLLRLARALSLDHLLRGGLP